MRKYIDIEVTFRSSSFDIEMNDEFLKFAEQSGIDLEDDGELLKFYLENNFEEYKDLLQIEDCDFEFEED